MRPTTIAIAIFALSSCYAGENNIGSEAKSLVDEIEDKCDKNYTYLRFELDGKDGKTVTMNIRVNKEQLGRCEMKEATVCVEGTDKKLDLGDPDNWYFRNGKSHTLMRVLGNIWGNLTSDTNKKGERDVLNFYCDEDDSIARIQYVAGVKGIYLDKKPQLWESSESASVWEYYPRDKSGEELSHYQDSMCFPESESQCDASGNRTGTASP